MAKCGIKFINIGGKRVGHQSVVNALESASGIKDVNKAVAKSYESIPKTISFKDWDTWFRKAYETPRERDLTDGDIDGYGLDREKATKLKNLVNLVDYSYKKDGRTIYKVDNETLNTFNAVKRNLIARGEGLSNEQIDAIVQGLEETVKVGETRRRAAKLRKQAKINVRKKLGASVDLIGPLDKLLGVQPKDIPVDKLDAYLNVLEEVGARKAVLSLRDKASIINDVNDVLKDIVVVKDKVKKESKEIDPAEKNILIQQAETKINGLNVKNLPLREERDIAREIKDITTKELEQLSNNQLENLSKGVDNINNGISPSSSVVDILIDLQANKSKETLIKFTKTLPKYGDFNSIVSRAYGKIASFINPSKGNSIAHAIRTNPARTMDDIFGKSGSELYNTLHGHLGPNYATYQSDFDAAVRRIDASGDKIRRAAKQNPNKIVESQFKVMRYLLQQEYESNEGSPGVAPASEWFDKTINAAKKNKVKIYNRKTIEIMEGLQDKFKNKEISLKDLSKAERESVKAIKELNADIQNKALVAGGVIRGNLGRVYSDYIHHSALLEEDQEIDLVQQQRNKFMGTKAGPLLDRSSRVGAINLNPFSSTLKAANEVLLDYHMTRPVREVQRAINKAKDEILGNKEYTSTQEDGIIALSQLVDDILDTVFVSSVKDRNWVLRAGDALVKYGYWATLGRLDRVGQESLSNAAIVGIAYTGEMTRGVPTWGGYATSSRGELFLKAINSNQTRKFYGKGSLQGKLADPDRFIDPGKIKNVDAQKYWVLRDMDAAYKNVVENKVVKGARGAVTFVAEGSISFSDKSFGRVLQLQAFTDKFKELTGIEITPKNVHLIESKDEDFFAKYKNEITEARKYADDITSRSFSSVNPFDAIQKNVRKRGEMMNVWRTLNSFLSKFLITEFRLTMYGINAAFGNGDISRVQGARLAAGAFARMLTYNLATIEVMGGIFRSIAEKLFGWEFGDEEDEDYKLTSTLIYRNILSVITTLVLRRNFGALESAIPTLLVEDFNEKHLEDLRDGEEYNSYDHSLMFGVWDKRDFENPNEGLDRPVIEALGPHKKWAKTLNDAYKDYKKMEAAKRPLTKQKYRERLNKRYFEAFGNAGAIPLYNDMNRTWNDHLYNKWYKNAPSGRKTRKRQKRKRTRN